MSVAWAQDYEAEPPIPPYAPDFVPPYEPEHGTNYLDEEYSMADCMFAAPCTMTPPLPFVDACDAQGMLIEVNYDEVYGNVRGNVIPLRQGQAYCPASEEFTVMDYACELAEYAVEIAPHANSLPAIEEAALRFERCARRLRAIVLLTRRGLRLVQ